MLFNTIEFLLFFAVVVLLYYVLPSKARRGMLLAASYYMYMCWKAEYVLVLAGATLVDYWLALAMAKAATSARRKRYLILSIVLSLATLVVFKYLDFFGGAVRDLLAQINVMANIPSFRLLQPVGISYYTFKKISYMIDVYREQQEPERHLGKFALYIAFFPEQAAGPIDRAGDLLPQFHRHQPFDQERIIQGGKLLVWGMFKKVVIADRLAVMVDHVYRRPDDQYGLTLLIATVFFSIQIYADFSGYTDMAIGIGQVLGFRLADNFNRPYAAKTVTEFWRRWHMSFTTWLRDYLFLPIAYGVSRRIKKARAWKIKAESWAYMAGTVTTMLICGLWHGAGWTFLVWGGLHGLYMVIAYATRKPRKKWRKKRIPKALKKPYQALRVLMTFSVVTLLWVFFKAKTLPAALNIVVRIFNPNNWAGTEMEKDWINTVLLMGQSRREVLIVLSALGLMLLIQYIQGHEGMRQMFSQKPLVVRWVLYILLILFVMNYGQVKEIPFIYAEF